MSSPVAEENLREGHGGWWRAKHAPAGSIEGWASRPSVLPGERLELHVSTNPPARYHVDIYRLGWYGGAGGRAVARHPEQGESSGVPRATPGIGPGPQVLATGWPATDSILVGEDWLSGQFVARLVLHSGEEAGATAFVPFVVREPPGRRAAGLVQIGITTDAAYNNWGGKSLYASNSSGSEPAVKVTLDRPVPTWHEANLNARSPFVWDLQLIRFLEREGYDLAYATDLDVHREPWALNGRTLAMTSGHDEYWTSEMRDAWDAALAEGVNVACMGANTCYWQIRLEDDDRTIVEYRRREADPETDPSRTTELFRDLEPPRPEAALFGVQYQDGMKTSKDPPRAYVVTAPDGDPWLADTGLQSGDVFADRVGYEWDALQAGQEPAGATVLMHHDDPALSHADCVRWRAPSGSLVFAAGSLQLSWALDDWAHPGHGDKRLQHMMGRAMADLLAPAGEQRA
jgi:hypothetical protein